MRSSVSNCCLCETWRKEFHFYLPESSRNYQICNHSLVSTLRLVSSDIFTRSLRVKFGTWLVNVPGTWLLETISFLGRLKFLALKGFRTWAGMKLIFDNYVKSAKQFCPAQTITFQMMTGCCQSWSAIRVTSQYFLASWLGDHLQFWPPRQRIAPPSGLWSHWKSKPTLTILPYLAGHFGPIYWRKLRILIICGR